jgi:hypothetical protein
MRYHFVPLALVVGLLAGCGDDPTAPSIRLTPPLGPGHTTVAKPIPVVDPGLCLKERIQLDARVDHGGLELPHPVCKPR